MNIEIRKCINISELRYCAFLDFSVNEPKKKMRKKSDSNDSKIRFNQFRDLEPQGQFIEKNLNQNKMMFRCYSNANIKLV